MDVPRDVYELLRSNTVENITSVIGHLCSVSGVAINSVM